MKINIELDDYLSHEEIKDILSNSIREYIALQGNCDRILSNLAYFTKESFIDSILTKEDKKTVIKKTKEVLKQIKGYNIFRQKGMFEESDSLGQKYLNEAVTAHKQLLFDRVKEAILTKDLDHDLFSDFGYILFDGIKSILTKNEDKS